jgi:hypothetical protein
MTGLREFQTANGLVSFTYPNTPSVSYGWREISTIQHFPSFFLHSERGSMLMPRPGTGGVGAGGTTTVGTELSIPDLYMVTVVGMFADYADEPAELWMQRGFFDLRETVMAHTTLGGTVRKVEFLSMEPDRGFLSSNHVAEFEQQLGIVIDTRFITGD